MTNMEKFQNQQKQMEELNKQKKAMLATAIQQRYLFLSSLPTIAFNAIAFMNRIICLRFVL